MSSTAQDMHRLLEDGELVRTIEKLKAEALKAGEDAVRAAVIAEARTWIGTPWHHSAGVKGAGVDCLHLPVRCYQAAGIVPKNWRLPSYSAQWHLHRDEPLYLHGIGAFMKRITEPKPADLSIYVFGRQAAHAAIIVDDELLIHAYSDTGSVTMMERRAIESRLHSYWSIFA